MMIGERSLVGNGSSHDIHLDKEKGSPYTQIPVE